MDTYYPNDGFHNNSLNDLCRSIMSPSSPYFSFPWGPQFKDRYHAWSIKLRRYMNNHNSPHTDISGSYRVKIVYASFENKSADVEFYTIMEFHDFSLLEPGKVLSTGLQTSLEDVQQQTWSTSYSKYPWWMNETNRVFHFGYTFCQSLFFVHIEGQVLGKEL